MGANFQTMTLIGSNEQDDVKAAFEKAQDEDRYHNGHSYSGGFGMAAGLRFDNRTFDNETAAYEYLSAACEKWEEARAVTFLNEQDEAIWMIGALCAS